MATMLTPLLLVASSGLISTAQAYTEWNTNCTLPPHRVNYVSSPNTRGSLDIVWSCFGTLAASVYAVLHFNIPPRREHVKGKWRLRMLKHEHFFLLMFWCCATMLVPEVTYCTTIVEFLDAWNQRTAFRNALEAKGMDVEGQGAKGQHAKEMAKQWNMTHMFFANMGGFVLLYRVKSNENQSAGRDRIKSLSEAAHAKEPDMEYVIGQSFLIPEKLPERNSKLGSQASAHEPLDDSNQEKSSEASQQDAIHDSDRRISSPMNRTDHAEEDKESTHDLKDDLNEIKQGLERKTQEATSRAWRRLVHGVADDARQYYRYHLNANLLRAGIMMGKLPYTPVRDDEISDRSKSDWFAKLLVMLQLIGFFVAILGRLIYGLPITPLEVATSAFAICSLGAWMFLIFKPKDASTPVVLATYDSREELDEDLEEFKRYLKSKEKRTNTSRDGKPPRAVDLASTLTFDVAWKGSIWLFLFCCGSAIFGGIHVAGWNLQFPSVADMWLWRSCAIATTAIPATIALGFGLLGGLAGLVSTVFEKVTKKDTPEWLEFIFVAIVVLAFGILILGYVLARLVLIVEMFRTLFYLPPGAYNTPSWSIDIPHIS